MAANHDQPFRPLRGGVSIYNPKVRELGTLGLIATSDGVDRWMVSAFHVLCRPDGTGDGDEVQQPAESPSVAHVSTHRASRSLDVAAARLLPTLQAVGEVVGIGPVTGTALPSERMRVLKSGVRTGVTEGIVDEVSADSVIIRPAPGFPSTYDISLPGDSGAVWVDRDTRRVVALHVTGNNGGAQFARAVPIDEVLRALRLQILVSN